MGPVGMIGVPCITYICLGWTKDMAPQSPSTICGWIVSYRMFSLSVLWLQGTLNWSDHVNLSWEGPLQFDAGLMSNATNTTGEWAQPHPLLLLKTCLSVALISATFGLLSLMTRAPHSCQLLPLQIPFRVITLKSVHPSVLYLPLCVFG